MTWQQLDLDRSVYYIYPEPAVLAKTTDSAFCSGRLTLRKSEYFRDISRQLLAPDHDLDAFRTYPNTESVIGQMRTLRGIDRWTAELTIHREIHCPDAFPAEDVDVRRFILMGRRSHRLKSARFQKISGVQGKGWLQSILMWQTSRESITEPG
jgi:3-methyladenine DNA glycosylase/8-oxoguanine DNA glycosylase